VNEKIGEPTQGPVVAFGDIEMVLAGEFKMNMLQAMNANKVFSEMTVSHSTVWVYKAGTPVFELAAPGGVYVMQSYSQAVDRTLTVETLPSLGSRLALPRGWTFKVRVLDEDFILESNGNAVVINDDFGCTYQKI
jgi:hypothetical protein